MTRLVFEVGIGFPGCSHGNAGFSSFSRAYFAGPFLSLSIGQPFCDRQKALAQAQF
jgi:hypothetical protein